MEEREDAAERIVQRYRDGLTATYPGADPSVLDEMAINFAGALLLEMERVGLTNAADSEMGHA
jgi:hypothetical protein